MSVWQEVIQTFAVPNGLTIIRREAATYSGGFATEPTEAELLLLNPVAMHPATGRDMESLPEGERTNEILVLYAVDRLKTAQDPASGQPDRFEYDGETFEIKTEQPWLPMDSNCRFYKFLAMKVPVS